VERLDNLRCIGPQTGPSISTGPLEGRSKELLDWAISEGWWANWAQAGHGSRRTDRSGPGSGLLRFLQPSSISLIRKRLPLPGRALRRRPCVRTYLPCRNKRAGVLRPNRRNSAADCAPLAPRSWPPNRFSDQAKGSSTSARGPPSQVIWPGRGSRRRRWHAPRLFCENGGSRTACRRGGRRLGPGRCGPVRAACPARRPLPIPDCLRPAQLAPGHGMEAFCHERYKLIGRGPTGGTADARGL